MRGGRRQTGTGDTQRSRWWALSAVVLTVLCLAGCGWAVLDSTGAGTGPAADPRSEAPPSMASLPTQPAYADPVAYCAAIGTIDAPDARYTGPPNPPVIVTGFADATGLPSDSAFRQRPPALAWRCAGGRVLVCSYGANIPCGKANTSRQPTAAMVAYCAHPPEAFTIVPLLPFAVTGHDGIYTWTCRAGWPEVVDQQFAVDAQGFIARFWYPLPDR